MTNQHQHNFILILIIFLALIGAIGNREQNKRIEALQKSVKTLQDFRN